MQRTGHFATPILHEEHPSYTEHQHLEDLSSPNIECNETTEKEISRHKEPDDELHGIQITPRSIQCTAQPDGSRREWIEEQQTE